MCGTECSGVVSSPPTTRHCRHRHHHRTLFYEFGLVLQCEGRSCQGQFRPSHAIYWLALDHSIPFCRPSSTNIERRRRLRRCCRRPRRHRHRRCRHRGCFVLSLSLSLAYHPTLPLYSHLLTHSFAFSMLSLCLAGQLHIFYYIYIIYINYYYYYFYNINFSFTSLRYLLWFFFFGYVRLLPIPLTICYDSREHYFTLEIFFS